MAAFDNEMNVWMKDWRKRHINDRRHGWQNKKQRAWILPKAAWEEGLWEGIRSESNNSLPAYLDKTGVQKHVGSHNLKSSWVMCAKSQK